MQSANLGILVFDVFNSRLLFANSEARSLLEHGGVAADFVSARSAFGGSWTADNDSLPRTDSCRIGARLIGFTSYKNGSIEWLFCRDISERARLEAVAEAIEVSNSFGHVFSAVRHEIGNPINSATMALSVLRRNFDRLDRQATLDYLDSTLEELGRVSELLSQLRSFSLYENVDPQRLAVDEFLHEFVAFASRDLKEQGVTMNLVAGAPGAIALADARALRQVLMGLVANAVEAMASQKCGEIHLESKATESVVVLEVRDSGPGVPRDLIPKLFKPFFTTKAGGTGLGLVIARKMLARMAATIAVESNLGLGACVVVTLSRGER